MNRPIRRILLIWPEFQLSFWGMHHGLGEVGKRAMYAPLALVTVAGMLPADKYEFVHLDLNCQPLTNEHLEWADLIMLSGWGPQWRSIRRVGVRARMFGKKTLIGGPIATEYQELLGKIDHIFVGEAEGYDLEALIDEIGRGCAERIITKNDRPDIASDPVIPRFDLLRLSDYWLVSIQHARGCPFKCEFCDIIELYGRVPRTKRPETIVKELETLYECGFRGPVFFVDDNFYGNRKAVGETLEAIIEFQRRRDYPFLFGTQTSVNIADNPKMLGQMQDAGFYSIFTGIETPNADSLKEAQKVQNLKVDLLEVVDEIHAHAITVQAGFIVGFDNDPPDIAKEIIEFVRDSRIACAMTGMLVALPQTQLERRLIGEKRMLSLGGMDQFGLPNFIPKQDPLVIVQGYQKILRESFEKEALAKRAQHQRALFDHAPAFKRDFAQREIGYIAKHLGIYGPMVAEELEQAKSGSRLTEMRDAWERHWGQTSRRSAAEPAQDAPAQLRTPKKEAVGRGLQASELHSH